jgi:hypothetical protein
MKAYTVLVALFATMAIAAPAVNDAPTKVPRNPTRVKRFYGEQFCDCFNDCKSSVHINLPLALES